MTHVANDMEAVLPGLALGQAVLPRPESRTHYALMERCQRGDSLAFEQLVRLFHARVHGIVRGVLRHCNDLDDVTQQIFAKIYFSLRNFGYRSAVSTWIYKIAVNECYDYLRKQRVRRTTILADLSEEEAARLEQGPAQTPPPGLNHQVEMKDLAAKLLARLVPQDRIMLVLKEIEGFSVQEIAAIVNLNENTVKVRLFRARRALMTALERNRV